MADTLLNTLLPENTWVDIYADTGIIVGTVIVIQNIGVCDVYLVSQAAQPNDDDKRQIVKRAQFAKNDFGDTGAWAFCRAGGAINVRLP